MASSWSDILKLELMTTGEKDGSWGTITNANLDTALEEAITGIAAVSFASDADKTLTLTNSNATQDARNLILNVTSAVSLTASRNLIVPVGPKQYIVWNNTTGSQSIVIKTSAGTGVTVPNGAKMLVVADGTNVQTAINYLTTPVVIGQREVKLAIPASDIDLAAANYFTRTISATTSLTVSNVPATGLVGSFILELTNGGAYTVNWWAGTITWPDGTPPILTTSGRDVLGFYTHDGGTTWSCFLIGENLSV